MTHETQRMLRAVLERAEHLAGMGEGDAEQFDAIQAELNAALECLDCCACDGRGWIVATRTEAPGRFFFQRCDMCGRFDSDGDAARHVTDGGE